MGRLVMCHDVLHAVVDDGFATQQSATASWGKTTKRRWRSTMNRPNVDWTLSEESERVLGDRGPWVRYLALAWQATNLPEGLEASLPTDPTPAFLRAPAASDDHARLHGDLCAYWGPLTHLLCFGLGWSRADLGLVRWLEQGAPSDDPILRLVARWWGPERLIDFLAWSAAEQRFVEFGRRIAEIAGYRRFDDTPLPDRYEQRRSTAAWQAVWGGGTDPLHLIGHSSSPMTYPDGDWAAEFNPVPHWSTSQLVSDPAEVPRMVIVNGTYRAWHAMLWHYRPGQGSNGRSIRTDIVIKPVGWMGEYRHSSQTGAWFRGRHRWHLLGH